MADLVVTCPQGFWRAWILEGDAAGDPPTGQEWAWFTKGRRPPIDAGERLYVVAWGKLRGYAIVTRVVRIETGWAICREGGAVACTIDEDTRGFQGYRKRWWPSDRELPFPDWKTHDARKR